MTFRDLNKILLVALAGYATPALGDTNIESTKNGPFIISGLTMHQDQLVFASAGFLWQVDRKGGEAKAITKGSAEDRFPHFSPDGSQVAFTRNNQKNSDVYTINLSNSKTKRLTNHPSGDWAVSWTVDGQHVNFSSARASGRVYRLYQVASEQGFASVLPTKFGNDMSYRQDGAIAYVPMSHNPSLHEFRYYRGGLRGEIHIVKPQKVRPNQNQQWQPISKIAPKDANAHSPMWLDKTLYYISDEDGIANLYSLRGKLQDQQQAQLTHFKRHGVRDFAVDNNGLVVLQEGYFHRMNLDGTALTKLAVTIPTSNKLKRTRRINAAPNTSELSLSNDGSKYIIVARGDVFVADGQSGKSNNITKTANAAERSATISPDGQSIAYFSDASGHYQLSIQSLTDKTQIQSFAIEQNPSFYQQLAWSPDSNKLTFNGNRLKLWMFDRISEQFTVVAKSEFSGQNRFYTSWSNDSNLFAYGLIDGYGLSRVFVYHHDQKRSQAFSPKGQYANHPLFDQNGRYLYYFASPNANSTGYRWAVLNGIRQAALRNGTLKAVVLNQGDQAPIMAGLNLPNLNVDFNDIKTPVTIDYKGLSSRTITLDIGNQNIARMSTSAPGKLQVLTETLSVPIRLYSRPQFTLNQLDLRNPTVFKPLQKDLSSMDFSSDGQRAYYTKGTNTYLVDLNPQPKEAEQPPQKMPTFTLFKSLDPVQEWQQMFNETFNFMVENLYDPNLHGNDPQQLYSDYARYLPNISSRLELSYLLKRMAGFLSVSHAVVAAGDLGPGKGNHENIGLLGADFTIDSGRYQFTKVLRQTSSQNSSFAPLDQYGAQVKEGEYLIAVNNQQITSKKNLYRYFVGLANRVLFITVADNPEGKNARKLQVKALSNEIALRTENWAEANKRYIEQQTQGKIKYVHITRFNQQGIEDFLAEYYRLGDASGLIIDVRFNPGGTTSDTLIELLSRKTLYKYRFRQGVDLSGPVNSFDGESTLIINQWNGSAAETFAQMYKAAKIGNVVGKPTYGAGIGPYAFGLNLVDGARVQIPNRGSYLPNGKWTIENRGLHPNIDVPMDLYSDGPANDAQLNMALKKNLEQINNAKPQQWIEPEFPVHPGSKVALQ